jgi:hypothetical protein
VGDYAQSHPGPPLDSAPDPATPSSWSRFGAGDEADMLPPGQLLAGLTEEAVRELGRLSDNELIGVLRAPPPPDRPRTVGRLRLASRQGAATAA